MEYHRAVLVDEVMGHLIGEPGLYLDGTLGAGGHARALLERCPECRVLGVDRDPEALAAAQTLLTEFPDRVRLIHGSFRHAADDPEVGAEGLAGALLDLGVSSHQLDDDRRGFTFRRGAPLDMRMDPSTTPAAAELLASASRAELLEALRRGQAPRPGALADRIVKRRGSAPFRTSDNLVAALESVLGRQAKHSEKARVFQAVRMWVNGEVDALTEALEGIRDRLRPGAVLVVLSYHSVEDGIVKNAFRAWSDPSHRLPPKLPVRDADLERLGTSLTKKPVEASDDEIRANPRARPVRLRAWRRAA